MTTNIAVEMQTAPVVLADTEAEEALLAELVYFGDRIHEAVAERLQPEHFFVVRHAWVYDVMLCLRARGADIDYNAVIDEMQRRRVRTSPPSTMLDEFGGRAELTKLLAMYDTLGVSSVRSLARIIRQYAERRALLDFCSRVAKRVYEADGEPIALWSDAMSALTRLRPHTGVDDLLLGRDSIAVYDKIVEDERENPVWYPPPWRALRDACPASKPGDIVIIAGPEGSGKSAMAFNWAQFYAEAMDCRVLYIHTEMDKANVLARRKAANSRLPYSKLVTPDELTDADMVEFHRADERIARWAHNLDMWEAGAIQARELLTRVQAHVDEHGTKVVVIDGLNDIDFQVPRTSTLSQATHSFMAYLETFARQNGLLIIGTVQLNREGKEYGSSAFRQKASLLLAIKVEAAQSPQGMSFQGITYGCETGEPGLFRKVRVEKNRRGKSGQDITLAFLGARFLWVDPPGKGGESQPAPLDLGV